MWTVYFSALILGLGSSFHCLGMCGPLVMAVPMKGRNQSGRITGMTQYFLGKTLTYAIFGLLVGLVGISVQALKGMQILSVISGILIILIAWGQLSNKGVGVAFQQKMSRVAGKSLRQLSQSNIPFKSFFFGMINGLLPCGLVYVALINSLLAGSPVFSALAMVFFGIGTIPILTLTKWITSKIKWNANRLTPIFITLVGVMIIFRGLNLGIPYLSPKIDTHIVQNEEGVAEEKVEVSCCSMNKEEACD